MADLRTRRRALVTGAGGYVAGALVPALLARNYEVVRLSRRALPSVTGLTDVVGDPRQMAIWTGPLLEVDTVFHLASETSANAAALDPSACLQATVGTTVNMIEAFRRAGKKPDVVYASTCSVFGVTETLPVDETVPASPETVYDLHKLMAEMHIALATRQGAIRGCSLRLANVYGWSPQANGAGDRGILNRMVRLGLAGKPITIYGGGDYLRDYIHLDDVADGLIAADAAMERCKGRSFLLATGQGATVGQAFSLAAERVTALTGRKTEVAHVDWPVPPAPIECRNFVGSNRGLAEAAEWAPRISLRDGIDRTVTAILKEGS